MMKCTELAKKGNKSLVEIMNTETERIEKYVVCNNFDNAKAYGSKWDWGTYFDVNSGDDPEEKLEKAIRNLYGMENDKREISYDRMTDLAKAFLAQLRDYVDDDEEFRDILINEGMTEDEADFFDIRDIVFPKLYKVINATFMRKQYATIQVVIPNDEDEWNADDYVENKEYIEDSEEIESEDREFDDYSIEENEISKEDFKSRYDNETVWNADDIDDM